jgi:hypothetical protein
VQRLEGGLMRPDDAPTQTSRPPSSLYRSPSPPNESSAPPPVLERRR